MHLLIIYTVHVCLHSVPDLPGAKQGSDSASSRVSRGSSQSDVQVLGRIVLNIWRLMRHEVSPIVAMV